MKDIWLIDKDCFYSFDLFYFWYECAGELFFCDNEESWFLGEFEVVSDCLSDADVLLRDDGCDFCEKSRCAWVVWDDFDDAPVHVWCDFFEMTGGKEV